MKRELDNELSHANHALAEAQPQAAPYPAQRRAPDAPASSAAHSAASPSQSAGQRPQRTGKAAAPEPPPPKRTREQPKPLQEAISKTSKGKEPEGPAAPRAGRQNHLAAGRDEEPQGDGRTAVRSGLRADRPAMYGTALSCRRCRGPRCAPGAGRTAWEPSSTWTSTSCMRSAGRSASSTKRAARSSRRRSCTAS